MLDIAEYGPKGPWWYDVINVRCEGPSSKCNRDAADAWSAEAKGRKRSELRREAGGSGQDQSGGAEQL